MVNDELCLVHWRPIAQMTINFITWINKILVLICFVEEKDSYITK